MPLAFGHPLAAGQAISDGDSGPRAAGSFDLYKISKGFFDLPAPSEERQAYSLRCKARYDAWFEALRG